MNAPEVKLALAAISRQSSCNQGSVSLGRKPHRSPVLKTRDWGKTLLLRSAIAVRPNFARLASGQTEKINNYENDDLHRRRTATTAAENFARRNDPVIERGPGAGIPGGHRLHGLQPGDQRSGLQQYRPGTGKTCGRRTRPRSEDREADRLFWRHARR